MRHPLPSWVSWRGLIVILIVSIAMTFEIRGYLQPHPQSQLPSIQLQVGSQPVQAEVALTPEEQERGLMFRKSLPDNQGMLFVFQKLQPQCFWMHNTPLPLSIAFMNDGGKIISIQDMAPETNVGHCSGKPVRYALEMPQGWYAAKGVEYGSDVAGLPAP